MYLHFQELEVTLEDPEEGIVLIRMEHILRTEANDLRSKKESRMKEVLELKREDEALCKAIDEDPHYVSSSIVPTTTQMEALDKHIASMRLARITILIILFGP
jgi:23S rRNA pseudoU1915 N3-methylase RlmH